MKLHLKHPVFQAYGARNGRVSVESAWYSEGPDTGSRENKVGRCVHELEDQRYIVVVVHKTSVLGGGRIRLNTVSSKRVK